MHSHSIDQWTHDHVFLGSRHDRHERRIWFVVALTATMMVGEIVVGWLSGSMALLADGWHMATHAAALGIAALAYLFARRQAGNSHFTFGTGKFGDLAAFSSAIILDMIAVQIAYESAVRLLHPVSIAYGEAIAVAALGLVVNIVSAWLLRDDHDHHHDHVHSRGHHHHDNNLRAAYVHVMADAATSILAIAALLVAMYAQWVWADPAVGIIGSLVIASWAYGLLRASGAVLLDVNADKNLEMVIRDRLETEGRSRHGSAPLAGRSRPSCRGDFRGLRPPAAAGNLQAPARRPAQPQPRHDRGRDLSARTRLDRQGGA